MICDFKKCLLPIVLGQYWNFDSELEVKFFSRLEELLEQAIGSEERTDAPLFTSIFNFLLFLLLLSAAVVLRCGVTLFSSQCVTDTRSFLTLSLSIFSLRSAKPKQFFKFLDFSLYLSCLTGPVSFSEKDEIAKIDVDHTEPNTKEIAPYFTFSIKPKIYIFSAFTFFQSVLMNIAKKQTEQP